jgi:hypothetical protein
LAFLDRHRYRIFSFWYNNSDHQKPNHLVSWDSPLKGTKFQQDFEQIKVQKLLFLQFCIFMVLLTIWKNWNIFKFNINKYYLSQFTFCYLKGHGNDADFA